MYLLWLRVAAILYAAASVAVFPAVLYGLVRWRKTCVHLGGMALLLPLCLRGRDAGPGASLDAGGRARGRVAAGLGRRRACSSWSGGFTTLSLWESLPCRLLSFWFLCPRWGRIATLFPPQGVRTSWLVAHIAALLVAYAALGFSLLASVLYLVQERRIKSKPRPGEDSWWAPLDWLPPLDTLERIAHATLEFGFPCMTVGLVIGSVLAQETPLGAAYFLDPKIIAAFVSWVVYVLLLLVRRSAGLRGRKAAYLSGAVFVVMLAVLVCQPLQPRAQVRCRNDAGAHRRQPQDRAHRAARAHRHLPRGAAGDDPRPGRHARGVGVHDRLHLQPRGAAGRRRLAGYRSGRFSASALRPGPGSCLRRTSTSITTGRRCAISSAWPPAWTRWWWASRRFWAR